VQKKEGEGGQRVQKEETAKGNECRKKRGEGGARRVGKEGGRGKRGKE
jgi:hypothetical protein